MGNPRAKADHVAVPRLPDEGGCLLNWTPAREACRSWTAAQPAAAAAESFRICTFRSIRESRIASGCTRIFSFFCGLYHWDVGCWTLSVDERPLATIVGVECPFASTLQRFNDSTPNVFLLIMRTGSFVL